MTLPSLKPRLLSGKLLVVVGIGLLALWIWYFTDLVRPMDIWDFCPLLVALALILLGVRFAGLGELLLAQAARSYKHDLVLALAFGILAELSLWWFLFHVVVDPESAERYRDLERLEEPGIRIGLAIYRYSYAHLGGRVSVHLADIFGFAVPITMWSLGALTLLRVVRFLQRPPAKPK
jgi:hypothetical protein